MAQPAPLAPPPTPAEVLAALRESVKLQSHYARLLNQYDLGRRLTFASAEAWIERLRTHGKEDLP